MYFTKTVVLTFIFVFSGLIQVMPIPAYPSVIKIVQPDGTTLTVRIFGDENRKIRTTSDGYPIRQNKAGYYFYDLPSANASSEIIARDPENRPEADRRLLAATGTKDPGTLLKIKSAPKMRRVMQSSAFPTTGSPRSLVIMVNFTDKSFTNTSQSFNRLLNETNYADNGATGSARDYFKASSMGVFNPQFDVVGPYQLTNTMAYYGANDEDDYDVRPADMVVEACSLANKDVNFAEYDADNDGYVDNIFIYYAGYNEAEGGPENTVWPHRWWVYSGNYSGSRTFDGKIVSDYACTSELKGNSGNQMCGIGTFTHEFGHVIGMPDHYHTEDPDKSTLDYWSIMDLGAYLNEGRTPPAYSAYDRFYLGWLSPEVLHTASQRALYPLSQSVTPVASTKGQAYLLSAGTHNLNGSNPTPSEFFVMEYRKKTGWDRYLPGEGMLIWHIDFDPVAWEENGPNNYTGTTQTASSHMRIYLQPLTGNSTTPGGAFTSGSFTPKTWQGVGLNRNITNITKTTDSIRFEITTAAVNQTAVIRVGEVKNELSFGATTQGNSMAKTINLKTTEATGTLQLLLGGSDSGQFGVSVTAVSATETEKTAGTNVEVVYKPTSTGQHRATLTLKSDKMPDRVIELKGEAR